MEELTLETVLSPKLLNYYLANHSTNTDVLISDEAEQFAMMFLEDCDNAIIGRSDKSAYYSHKDVAQRIGDAIEKYGSIDGFSKSDLFKCLSGYKKALEDEQDNDSLKATAFRTVFNYIVDLRDIVKHSDNVT